MRKLISILLVLLATTTLKAQNKDTVKAKYEYAFVYYTGDSLSIYFGKGKQVNITQLRTRDFGLGLAAGSITQSFDKFVEAFNYLEVRGYEFMATGISLRYESSETPYYIYRKKKLD